MCFSIAPREDAHSDSGPHCRWATGTLFDNVRIKGNELNVMNRGNAGSGHGWAGNCMVFWNCRAKKIACESPPTGENWAVGCKANQRSGQGNWEAFNAPVSPGSLYRAQLRERLGSRALQALDPERRY